MRFILQIIIVSLQLFFDMQAFTIMFIPAGTIQQPGRSIGDSYEHGISLQCAQKLKEILEENKHIKCIIARLQNSNIQDLETAQFANRFSVDLCISLNFFYHVDEKPHIYLYYFVLNPVTDFWHTNYISELSFIEYNQAHQKNISLSKKYIDRFYKNLQTKWAKNLLIHTPQGIPFKPLVGISAPSFAIEALITQTHTWQDYVRYFSKEIINLLPIQ